MDKTERSIREELSKPMGATGLDLDSLLAGTHARIRRRAIRRKTLYTTPIVALLILMVYIVIPGDRMEKLAPGSELLMAGWESSWTESELLETETATENLYEETIDYLIDNNYYSYADEAADLLDEVDLVELYGYMKEA